jgi:hypothetical protein
LAIDEFVYSDALVICGSPEVRPDAPDVVTNPSVVVEALSKSTEAYDRGDGQKGYFVARLPPAFRADLAARGAQRDL